MMSKQPRHDRQGFTALCRPALDMLAHNPAMSSVGFAFDSQLGLARLTIVKVPDSKVGHTYGWAISFVVGTQAGASAPDLTSPHLDFPTPSHAFQDALVAMRKRHQPA